MTKKKNPPTVRPAQKKTRKSSRVSPSTSPLQSQSPLIVGIGASAGGLRALEQFFSKMPSDSGMAFIVVLHLDPTHVSMLPELLAKYTKMPIGQAEDGAKVAANTIHIIPPNKKLAIKNGTLVVTEPTEPRGLRLPIDTFFRSLAEDQGNNAIGVILSGTGTDGTLGLKAIEAAGGLVIAQQLASAEFDGMPRSAIDTSLVHYVLAPQEIPAQLLSYAKGSRPEPHGTTTALADKFPETLENIFHVLRSQTGHDFSDYKKSTISRRIDRRMHLHQIENPADYLGLLERDAPESAALFKDLLIGVTNFFRDPEAFKILGRILKEMLEKKPKDSAVRIWVPGCSSGEEVYSIAIILREQMDALKKHFSVQIFGTDIDADAIECARAGIYPGSIVKDVAPARLMRFFLDESDGYHIKKEIREMAIFSIQDLVKDPPFTKLDLLSCRNLLIYLDGALQKRLVPLFHYALRPDGILFLGPSESIDGYVDLFAEGNRRWKIFKRKELKHEAGASVPFPFAARRNQAGEITSLEKIAASRDTRIPGVAEKLLLDRYAPPCVLINKIGDILYSHGPTNRYLALPQGQASLNILAMARGRVKNALATLIRKASAQKRPASMAGVQLRSDKKSERVTLTITPYRGSHGAGDLLLIVFENVTRQMVKSRKGVRAARHDAAQVARLEQDLWDAREQLQIAAAETQLPDEELRSYNEELQSANEELQSLNEELETSKEELQSLNEELTTVNAELQGKNEALSSANDDIRNLLDSTKIATLFLDTRLCVKRFSPEIAKIINLVEEDVGRPVSHFNSNLVGDNLAQKAQGVLDTLVPKENEISSTDGQWYLERIQPYRGTYNVIGGVVVTFVDITARKQLELAAQEARQFAQDIVETVRDPLVVLDGDFNVVSANESFYRQFNLTVQLTERHSLFELNKRQWDAPELRRLLGKVLADNQAFDNFTIECDSADLDHKILLLNARRIRRVAPGGDLILLAFDDVTDREKRAELRALAARLHAVREEERARLAREIHDELSGSLTALKMDLSLLPDRAAKDHHLFLEKLSSMAQLIDTTLAQVRTIVAELRPVALDKLGLVAAIEWQARQFHERSGIACETHLPAEEVSLDADRATALFRIFQETLTNVARHAHASKVEVELKRDAQSFILAVRDNGKGIDQAAINAASSLGLLGIRERAVAFGGNMELAALPERGTCVTVRIPVA